MWWYVGLAALAVLLLLLAMLASASWTDDENERAQALEDLWERPARDPEREREDEA